MLVLTFIEQKSGKKTIQSIKNVKNIEIKQNL